MREITLNTGLEHIVIKNEYGQEIGSFDFSPTDTGILDRFSNVAEHLSKVDLSSGNDDIMTLVTAVDKDIREQFDYLFNYPVSDQIFKEVQPLTTLPGGVLFFEQALDVIADLMKEVAENRAAEKKRKVKEATAKYQK